MARSSRHDAERAVHDAGLDDDDLIRRIDALAKLLDGQYNILGFRFGLDGLIGLIPGVGDAATAILSFYLIFMAARAGASFSLIMQMIVNVLIDTVIGALPILGDLFDFVFRANAINAKLLREHLQEKRSRN